MASTCISSCTDDVNGRALLPRASYISLHNWPESEAGGNRVSSRQMYLRSYTFSRKQSLQERTKKRFDEVRVLVIDTLDRSLSSFAHRAFWKSRLAIIKRNAPDLSCSALWDLLRRFIACSPKLDVAAHHGDR